MNIHEYQAKELFRSYNIPVSSGSVAYRADEIERAVNEVEGPVWWLRLKYMQEEEEKVEVSKLFHLKKMP